MGIKPILVSTYISILFKVQPHSRLLIKHSNMENQACSGIFCANILPYITHGCVQVPFLTREVSKSGSIAVYAFQVREYT